MNDILSKKDIEKLIVLFYSKTMVDPKIGHFFAPETGFKLEEHKDIIISFWDSLLFGARQYQGNPMEKHIRLNKTIPFKQEHFDRWLEIWKNCIHDLYFGENATEAIRRATLIAGLMMAKMKESEK